jgi:hypothetical protein
MPNYDEKSVRAVLPPDVKSVDGLLIQALWVYARKNCPIQTTEDFISWITRNSERCMKLLMPYRVNDPLHVRMNWAIQPTNPRLKPICLEITMDATGIFHAKSEKDRIEIHAPTESELDHQVRVVMSRIFKAKGVKNATRRRR